MGLGVRVGVRVSGAVTQVDLAEVTVIAEAVDLGTVVGSVGRGTVDLDLEIHLVRYSHGE